MPRRYIYESDTAKVFSVGDIDGNDVCVTFFTYASKEETLANVDGFAEAALEKHNTPTVHFINLTNHWWHIPDLEACLSHAAQALSGAKIRTGYGSSMGAYAALRFSERLKLNNVLGFVPQFSIDRQHVPFETRWARQAAMLDFNGEPYSISKDAACHLVVGDCEADLQHIRLIQAANPDANISLYEIGSGDHLILKDYQDYGLLSSIITALPNIDVTMIKRHPEFIRQSGGYQPRVSMWKRFAQALKENIG